MPKVSCFEDLEIWSNARELSKLVYGVTSTESFNRDFRFRDQIRASAGSIMDNIAERFEREENKEYILSKQILKSGASIGTNVQES